MIQILLGTLTAVGLGIAVPNADLSVFIFK